MDLQTVKQLLQKDSRFLTLPLIQGGMGVGISRSNLAGAVAREGAMGTVSTAQIGYDLPGFASDEEGCNERAIALHIQKARVLSEGHGMVAVNVMTALRHYREHVTAAVRSGADAVICGAGLPLDLPALVQAAADSADITRPLIAPIVSSARAASLLLRSWDQKYQTTADFLVAEGPLAGGHLGFSEQELASPETIGFDQRIRDICAVKKEYEGKYGHAIPLFAAGGIFDAQDIRHAQSLGTDGVQIASRFVVTEECDASEAYKGAYLKAEEKDIQLVKSPVGMPGRAIRNAFLRRLESGREPVAKCYHCLAHCNPATVPYCITAALTRAVQGDVENGLLFCGANTWRIQEMTTVHALIRELFPVP